MISYCYALKSLADSIAKEKWLFCGKTNMSSVFQGSPGLKTI